MIKKIKSILLFGCSAMAVIAQTTLPTSWNFTNFTLPTGWSEQGVVANNPYTQSVPSAPFAAKFDNTGEYLQVYFSDAPGALTYQLKGNNTSGAFQGTFNVEESVNGTSWTVLRSHTAPSTSAYTLYTDNPNSASRYIRFIFVNKVSGHNIGIDDINLAIAPATPAQEINVKYNNLKVANGSTIYLPGMVGMTMPHALLVENLGTATTLSISSTAISGTNQSDFTITSAPSAVTALSTGTINIDFTPPVSGTRLATLTISNNDADESSYVVYLYGIGGNFASQPTSPAAFTVVDNKSYRIKAKFNHSNPKPDAGYIVLVKKGSAVTDVPTDGANYGVGDNVGVSKVCYVGLDSAFYLKNTLANTNYHFAVYAFNGGSSYTKYSASPLQNATTSVAKTMVNANYYNGVSVSNANFLTTLSSVINPHTSYFYGNYAPTILNNFEAQDTANGQKYVTCVYSGDVYVYTPPFSWTTSDYSREHTYCHNWMPTNPADQPVELPEYNDQHHLFPTEFTNANQIRLNYPLGEVVGTPLSTFKGCKLGFDVYGKKVFEPKDSHKGDAARALMYMAVCYNGVSGNNWKFPNPISGTIPYGQNQDVLKKWHYQDLPDSWEISRNDYLDSLQGNRNPFIDSVHFACYIDFYTMTKISSPSLPCNTWNSIVEQENAVDFMLYPNPSQDGKFTFVALGIKENMQISVSDISGRIIWSTQIDKSTNMTQAIDLSNASKGVYVVKVDNGNIQATQKLIIE
ncbi:MAG: endonuclease [Bacteroidetes bacterium]|nr:endonuclease [Bacteroidota bacterium]